VHASVFSPYAQGAKIKERLYWRLYPFTLGRFASLMSEKCYPISADAADVAVRFLGVQKHKIVVRSLGVDTDLFKPIFDEASRQTRLNIRKQLGFSDSDIVCIYTGRFDKIKNPLCLAHSIESLTAQGRPFKGLFIGNGSPLDIDALRSCKGCVVHSYVPVQELVKFYWASDIAVWPKHESTSQLDAAACGLPLILSNRIKVYERIDGNGLLYEEDNVEDLSYKLNILADTEMRQRMGKHGAKKIAECFSWKSIAERYIKDYETVLKH
jgi:glycosyltransferase involved in cell wall biosynthesis